MLREIFAPIIVMFAVIVMIGEAYTDMKKQRDNLKAEIKKEEQVTKKDHV